jgi:hypothetical protein
MHALGESARFFGLQSIIDRNCTNKLLRSQNPYRIMDSVPAMHKHDFTDLQLHQETEGAQIERVLDALVPATNVGDQNIDEVISQKRLYRRQVCDDFTCFSFSNSSLLHL